MAASAAASMAGTDLQACWISATADVHSMCQRWLWTMCRALSCISGRRGAPEAERQRALDIWMAVPLGEVHQCSSECTCKVAGCDDQLCTSASAGSSTLMTRSLPLHQQHLHRVRHSSHKVAWSTQPSDGLRLQQSVAVERT